MASERKTSPTLPQLEAAEVEIRDALVTLLGEEIDSEQEQQVLLPELNDYIKRLKLCIKKYKNISRSTETMLKKKGHVVQATEVSSNRVELVYTEYRAKIDLCNAILNNLGLDNVTIGSSSVISGATARSSINNVASKANADESDHINNNVDINVPSQVTRAESLSEHFVSVNDVAVGLSRLSQHDPLEGFLNPSARQTAIIDSDGEDKLDPFSRRQLRSDLLKGLGDSFEGDAVRYWGWKTQLLHRLQEAEVKALDTLHIIVANTSGRPKKLVKDLLEGGCRLPRETLDMVWTLLDERFGSDLLVSNALLKQIENFPPVTSDNNVSKMEDFLSLCTVVNSNMQHCRELTGLDLQRDMRMVWEKMPMGFQHRWRKIAFQTEVKTRSYPRFSQLVKAMTDFVAECSRTSLGNSSSAKPAFSSSSKPKYVKCSATEVGKCPFDQKTGHNIHQCTEFQKLSLKDRKCFARDNRLCFLCLERHMAKYCPKTLVCTICNGKHSVLMHSDRPAVTVASESNVTVPAEPQPTAARTVATSCTSGADSEGVQTRSKVLLVDVKMEGSPKVLRCLCVIDQESDATFCDPSVPEFFGCSPPKQTYALSTMSGLKTTQEACFVSNLQIKGVTETKWLDLPETVTNPHIPNYKSDFSTRELVESFDHTRRFAKNFLPADPQAEVLILVGKNCRGAMWDRNKSWKDPFVVHTVLGWCLIGIVHPKGNSKNNSSIMCCRTEVEYPQEHFNAQPTFDPCVLQPKMMSCADTFIEKPDDEMAGHSQQDQKFLSIIEEKIQVNDAGMLEMPLPLKNDISLPNNSVVVRSRTQNTLSRLSKDKEKLQECTKIMQRYLSKEHVEEIPTDEVNNNGFYIPVFPVVGKHKKKMRIVFDASAEFKGTSLNNCLLSGPDENNRIVGVLTRFRHGQVGFSADVELMFHTFSLTPESRDNVRFYWWRDNDPTQDIVPYRAKVHVFGLTSSPAVATFGMRYSARDESAQKMPEACKLIQDHFYVDDLLASADTAQEAVKLLSETREILGKYKIRLHKIASTDTEVLQSFPATELATDNTDVELSQLTTQSTLGLTWQISSDSFVISCQVPRKPFTKRGVLSTINSIYNPLGFVSPVVLTGRLIQRQILPPKESMTDELEKCGWDDPLPEQYRAPWMEWVESLDHAEAVIVKRCFTPPEFGAVTRRELHTYADASIAAIGMAVYLRSFNEQGDVHVSLVCGSSKVAPRAATSVPRLELCAAAEAATTTSYIQEEIGKPIDSVTYYSDSKVTLGYISNTERRFSRYVTARVQSILSASQSSQWKYVATHENTADLATKSCTPAALVQSRWFKGPVALWSTEGEEDDDDVDTQVELPEQLAEKNVMCVATRHDTSVAAQILLKFSSWTKVVAVMTTVVKASRVWMTLPRNSNHPDMENCRTDAVNHLIRAAQKESFSELYHSLANNKDQCPEELVSLSPFLDADGIIRVGGRCGRADQVFGFKHPVLLPQKHRLTELIAFHHHEKSHQGRFITSAAIRSAGFFIHHGTRMIKEMIKSCVRCKYLRGKFLTQKMADLPVDRLEESPPFTHCGCDVFGPYQVTEGRNTRGHNSTKKVWGLLFTCLVSRAVHVESLSSLDTATFRLALRRFMCVRGQCRLIRSDQGTNFVGARNQMAEELDVEALAQCASELGCRWEMNPPTASHFGGTWERQIGSLKRCLAASMAELCNRMLTRDELHTLFLEACNVMNSTPLYESSSDPSDPLPISPNNLLTLRDSVEPTSVDKFNKHDVLAYGKRRWRRVQYLCDVFWEMWRLNYLDKLNHRHKWTRKSRCITIDDIVLVKEASPRSQWPVGRVLDVKFSDDGLVRSVTLKLTSNGVQSSRVVDRPIHNLVLLTPSRDHKC